MGKAFRYQNEAGAGIEIDLSDGSFDLTSRKNFA